METLPSVKCIVCQAAIIVPVADIRILKEGKPVDMKDMTVKLEVACPSCGARQQVNWLPLPNGYFTERQY